MLARERECVGLELGRENACPAVEPSDQRKRRDKLDDRILRVMLFQLVKMLVRDGGRAGAGGGCKLECGALGRREKQTRPESIQSLHLLRLNAPDMRGILGIVSSRI